MQRRPVIAHIHGPAVACIGRLCRAKGQDVLLLTDPVDEFAFPMFEYKGKRFRAADRGEARAQFNLGLVFESGRGVPRDAARAYVWFDLAAARFMAAVAQTSFGLGLRPEMGKLSRARWVCAP